MLIAAAVFVATIGVGQDFTDEDIARLNRQWLRIAADRQWERPNGPDRPPRLPAGLPGAGADPSRSAMTRGASPAAKSPSVPARPRRHYNRPGRPLVVPMPPVARMPPVWTVPVRIQRR